MSLAGKGLPVYRSLGEVRKVLAQEADIGNKIHDC